MCVPSSLHVKVALPFAFCIGCQIDMFTAAVCSQVSTQWAGLAFSEQQGCFHEYLPGVSPPRRSLQWFGGEMHKDKAGRNIRRCDNSYVDKKSMPGHLMVGALPTER